MPLRDRATGDGDQVGLLRAGERLAILGLALMAQDHIDPALREVSADVEDGGAADVERAADLGRAPSLAEFEQDLGTSAGTRAHVSCVQNGWEARTIDLRQGRLIRGRLRWRGYGRHGRHL